MILHSPTGTHVRHRTVSLPACAARSRSGRPPMRFSSPSAFSIRGIDFEESPARLRPRDTRAIGFAHSPKTITITRPARFRGQTLPDSRRIGCRDVGPLLRMGREFESSPSLPAAAIHHSRLPLPFPTSHRFTRVETRPIRLRVRATSYPRVAGVALTSSPALRRSGERVSSRGARLAFASGEATNGPAVFSRRAELLESTSVSRRRFVGDERTTRTHE